MPETQTVCGSPHDVNDDISDEGEDDGEHPLTLFSRPPTVHCVLDEIKAMNTVKMSITHSPIFIVTNHNALFCLEIWEEINLKLVVAISAYAVSVEKEAKKATLKYVKECAVIDTYAAGLINHEAMALLNSIDPGVRHHVSLLLQIITMEYVEAFGKLITYTMSGDTHSIKEKVSRAFAHAMSLSTDKLFLRPKVRNNVYYIVGFLGNQAEIMLNVWLRGAADRIACCILCKRNLPCATKVKRLL